MMRATRDCLCAGRAARAAAVLRSGVRSVTLLSVILCNADRCFSQKPAAPSAEISRLAQQAQADLHDQKPELAAAEYRKILALDPNNLGAHSNLGLADYLQNQFAAAASEFNIALSIKPDLWNIAALCGLSEAKTGKNAEAVVHLDAAFQHVAEPSLRLAVGKQLFGILLQAGSYDRAASVADQLEQLDPTNMDVLYAAHQVYSLLADKAFTAMAERDPHSARMYQLRGDRMAQIGNMEGAIVAYRLAIARDPHLSGAHFALGEALSISPDADQRAAAEAEYKSALADNPLDEKSECRLGDIEMQRSNLQAAAEHYQRALQLQPDDPDANEGYGLFLLTSDSSQPDSIQKPIHDSIRQARTYLARAVQLDPSNAAAFYHLSQASRKAGDLQAAKSEMDEFLRLKAQRENLKRSLDDLPLRAARQAAQSQDEPAQPKAAPEAAAAGEDKTKR